jgi:hypothetical protein
MANQRIIHPVSELRFEMGISLSVTPRHIFKALGQPHEPLRDRYRAELIGRLTSGWDRWQIVRELHDNETAPLESLLATGRVLPLPPGWE